MKKNLILFSILILSTACIKTAEQVQREKKFDSISEQISDSQSLVTDMMTQIKQMQVQLDKMNGRLEELEHKNQQADGSTFTKISENVGLLQSQRESDQAQLVQIQNELKEQRGFLEKVTASLGSIQTNHSEPKTSSKKKTAREELNEAINLVKIDEFDSARPRLLNLLDHKDLSPGDKNKVLHGLGRVEFFTKNYDKALVYFSKIYTKYPKATLAPSSLLFIGRSFKRMGKTDAAKEAFTKLAEDYPGSKEVTEAKKEL
jgi:TolA-binding protein